jgi:hypothetical protein
VQTFALTATLDNATAGHLQTKISFLKKDIGWDEPGHFFSEGQI